MLYRHSALIRWQKVDQQDVDCRRFEQQWPKWQCGRHVQCRAIGGNGAIGGNHLCIGSDVSAKFHLNDA